DQLLPARLGVLPPARRARGAPRRHVRGRGRHDPRARGPHVRRARGPRTLPRRGPAERARLPPVAGQRQPQRRRRARRAGAVAGGGGSAPHLPRAVRARHDRHAGLPQPHASGSRAGQARARAGGARGRRAARVQAHVPRRRGDPPGGPPRARRTRPAREAAVRSHQLRRAPVRHPRHRPTARTAPRTYPEYHTSLDDLAFVKDASLAQALDALKRIVTVLEEDERLLSRAPYGEPQLGKRGLYEDTDTREQREALLWTLTMAD